LRLGRKYLENAQDIDDDINNWKMTLLVTITPVHEWTLVHKRSKVGLGYCPAKKQVFQTHIPRVINSDSSWTVHGN